MGDRKFTDRCFLLVESDGIVMIRLTVAGADLADLVDALRQVKVELETE
jgi:hypothetical protein